MAENRPLDVIEASVGQDVTVSLKGGDRFVGELVGFDQHMNLVLEPPAVQEEESADAEESGAATPDGVDNTTVIRGDNLVSIEP
jgi:small nuclear ribonucleoprotein